MYEKRIIHAIQHTNEEGFDARYRRYGSEEERNRVFEFLQKERLDPSPLERVKLIVYVETVPEQLEMEL